MSFIVCWSDKYRLNVNISAKHSHYIKRKETFNIKFFFPHEIHRERYQHKFTNCLLSTQNITNMNCHVIFYHDANSKPKLYDELIRQISSKNTFSMELTNKNYKKNQLIGIRDDVNMIIKNSDGNLLICDNSKIRLSRRKLIFNIDDEVTFNVKLPGKGVQQINKLNHGRNKLDLYRLYFDICDFLKINVSEHKRTRPYNVNWIMNDFVLRNLHLEIKIGGEIIQVDTPFNLMNFDYADAMNIENFTSCEKINDLSYKLIKDQDVSIGVEIVVNPNSNIRTSYLQAMIQIPLSEYHNNKTLLEEYFHLVFQNTKYVREGFNCLYQLCWYKSYDGMWKKCKLLFQVPSEFVLYFLNIISKENSMLRGNLPVYKISNVYHKYYSMQNSMYNFNEFLKKRNEILFSDKTKKSLPLRKLPLNILIFLEYKERMKQTTLLLFDVMKMAKDMSGNSDVIQNLRIVIKYGDFEIKSLKFHLYDIYNLTNHVHKLTRIPFDWNSRGEYFRHNTKLKNNPPLSYNEKRMLLNIIDITLFYYIKNKPLKPHEIKNLPKDKIRGSKVRNYFGMSDIQRDLIWDWLNNTQNHSKVPFISNVITYGFVLSEPLHERPRKPKSPQTPQEQIPLFEEPYDWSAKEEPIPEIDDELIFQPEHEDPRILTRRRFLEGL